MNQSSIIKWEDRLTRISLALLLLAVAYGVFVGAAISMYYDVTPDMGSLEDNLAPIQLILYLLAVILSLSHLPLAASDARHGLWNQALMRGLAIIGPLIIFLGSEGLISHYLGWLPISDSDRFHMLHHTVLTAAPLTLAYWLLFRWSWRPATISTPHPLSPRSWLVSGFVLMMLVMAFGIMTGFVSPPIFAVTATIGLISLLVFWRVAG